MNPKYLQSRGARVAVATTQADSLRRILILFLLTSLVTLLTSQFLFAQHKADDIVGVWQTKEGKGKVKIYRNSSNQYIGKIIWLKEPNDPANGKPKVDKNNPDASKHTQPIIGLFVLRNFVFKDGSWQDGKIYDPENGKDYSCTMKLTNNNTLEVRGYIGFSLLGRTEVWTRTTE